VANGTDKKGLWKAGCYEECGIKVIDIKELVIGFLYIIVQTLFGQPHIEGWDRNCVQFCVILGLE
jgi:hypothetical protein